VAVQLLEFVVGDPLSNGHLIWSVRLAARRLM
jgi:hypothetical protein